MLNRRITIMLPLLACLATTSAVPAADVKPSGDRLIAVLKSADASLKAKNDACRELATLGEAKAIPVLVGLLGDAKLSHMARYALEPISDASVDTALLAAMGKLKGRLRIGVINSIGMRRDEKAVSDLTKLLKDADKGVASAAIGSLGKIATPEAITALAGCRKAPPAKLQWAIADASLDVAERLLEGGKSAGAIAIYTELSTDAWPRQVRLGAFSGLLTADSDKAPERIAAALAGKDKIARAVAIARIATLKGSGISARFAAELPKLPTGAQVMLINALAGRNDPSARPAIVKATGHSDAAIRTAAIKALGSMGDTECVELLCGTIVGGKTEPEKQAAQSSLRALGAKGVDAVLIKRMTAAKGDLQIHLINILVDRKAASAADALLVQAATTDPKVRSAAFKGLGKIASPKNLPAILKLLVKVEDDATRREAELAAVSVSRRIAKPEDQADDVLTALKIAATTSAKRSLLAVLGGIGNDKAFAAIKSALGDKTPEINDAAVRALTVWPNAKASESLLAIFGATKDKTHRTLALRGIVRILSLGEQDAGETLAIYEKLLGGISQPADLKLVLSGLGAVPDPAALKIIEPFMSNKDVRNEARAAYQKVSKAIGIKGQTIVYTKLITVFYGAGKQGADVTGKVAERKNKAGTIAISNKYNDYFGDPVSGVPKQLVITFELNGKKQTIKLGENTPFTLKLAGAKKSK